METVHAMSKKIILFTSLNEGGILQLANQLAMTLAELKMDYCLMVPKGGLAGCASAVRGHVYEYDLPKTAHPFDKKVREVAAYIRQWKGDYFIAVDDALKAEVMVGLVSPFVKSAMVIHDVRMHPQEMNAYKIFSESVRRFFALFAYKKAGKIVLLSQNSYRLFQKRHAKWIDKCVIFPLGAHVIPEEAAQPKELQGKVLQDGYVLFFGRIDKYKGLERLIEAQRSCCRDPAYYKQLVVAGKNLTAQGFASSEQDQTFCVLRTVSNGEMIWLFEHCGVVVLPYHEASQSGILPIAYKYGKPVIVSDIDGLRELVAAGKTGLVFHDQTELIEDLKSFEQTFADASDRIKAFHRKEYDWNANLLQLIEKI